MPPTHPRACPICGSAPAPERPYVCPNGHPALCLEAERLVDAAADPRIGRLLDGRFGLLRKITVGGMGAIYEGIQLPIERQVAVKLIRPDTFGDHRDVICERFRREARAISRLKHPNAVTLYDYGETEDGELYIAMELIEGETLAEVVARGPISRERAVRIVIQIAHAMEYAHARGVVHRDLKPGNVMLTALDGTGDFVKVVDFGIARLMDIEREDTAVTLTGKFSGTPHYMSPEQVQGAAADHRSDIYTLGLILYALIAGRTPFQSTNAFNLAIKQLHDDPEPLGELAGIDPVSTDIQTCITRATRKTPEDRYPRAIDFQRALEAVSRQRVLGALWAGADAEADAVFDLLRHHVERIVEHVLEEIQSSLHVYQGDAAKGLPDRLRFFTQWAMQREPSETQLGTYLEAAWAGGVAEMLTLPDLLSACSCAFPAMRRLARELPGAERDLIHRQWHLIERHFWHMVRVLGTRYEQERTDRENRPFGVDPVAPRPAPQTIDIMPAADAVGQFAPRVIASMTSGVLVVSANNQTIVAVNPAFEQILELDHRELIGRNIRDALRPIRGLDTTNFIRELRERGELTPTRLRARTARGRWRWVQFRGSYFRDEEGRRSGVYVIVDDITEREMILESFRRYAGPEVVEDLLLVGRGAELRGERRVVTVVFVTLTGAGTALIRADDASPEATVRTLNRYYGVVVDAVTRSRGLVDSLVSEKVMAIFGAPFAHDDDPYAAVRAAVDIVDGIAELVPDAAAADIEVAVGIATGSAIVGNLGTAERVNYTAVGDVVQRADAMCAAAKAGEIQVDEETRRTTQSVVCYEGIDGSAGAWRVQSPRRLPSA